ncbi:MAG: radical SAM protein [Gammaproteobacteria bacterium]|nr:radical SAM protein [Gammaproteobacteria bacterium]
MFNPFPIEYVEPVFRPPSEARSLIVQVTIGCSWNRCTYCDMYTDPQKKFRPRAETDVLDEIRRCGEMGNYPRRVLLADGDAMVLSMSRLRTILQAIQTHLPDVTRVSAYCLPSNLKKKSENDLRELVALGLKLIYVGAESGDDTVLKYIDKGETYRSTADALIKAHEAGLKSSVMIINGMGGKKYSEQHALASARLVNETQPHYVATLVLTFYRNQQKVLDGYQGNFEELNTIELCQEIQTFITATELKSSVFRSDHASNHLILKGVLGKDKATMLNQIELAVEHFKQHPEFEHIKRGF